MWTLGTLPVISQIKQAVLLLLVIVTAACLPACTWIAQGTLREADLHRGREGWHPGPALPLLTPGPVHYGIERHLKQGGQF